MAISRGKRRVWIACEPSDFFTVCNQLDIKRRTVFSELMLQHLVDPPFKLPVSYEPSTIMDVNSLVLLDEGKECVPTLTSVAAQLADEKKKKKTEEEEEEEEN